MADISEYSTVQSVDGQSFTYIFNQDQLSDERPLFWHIPNNWGPTGPGIGPSSTIRKGDWKLIYYHDSQEFELFNIANDIGEHMNLEDSEPEIKEELARELGAYLRSVDAQMPIIKATDTVVPWPDEIIN